MITVQAYSEVSDFAFRTAGRYTTMS